MKSRDNYFAGFVAVALFLAVVWCCVFLYEQAKPDLETLTVDGISVDLSNGTEALGKALGDRFELITEDEQLSETTAKLLATSVFESEYLTACMYLVNDRESTLLFDGSCAAMSYEEYCKAYEGICRTYDMATEKCLEIIQLDGKILTPKAIEKGMSEFDETLSPENFSDVHSYIIDSLGDTTEEFVLLQCWFRDGECYQCSVQYFYSPIEEGFI